MEQFDFQYNYSLLSAAALRARGVKSLAELTEVFEDGDSKFEVLQEGRYPVLGVIGFTGKSVPLKIAFSNIEGTITFLDARVASKREVIDEFCRFCK
jgi:hypothetical protein